MTVARAMREFRGNPARIEAVDSSAPTAKFDKAPFPTLLGCVSCRAWSKAQLPLSIGPSRAASSPRVGTPASASSRPRGSSRTPNRAQVRAVRRQAKRGATARDTRTPALPSNAAPQPQNRPPPRVTRAEKKL